MTSSGNLAPIALFVYNRPEHTRLTIEALTINPEALDSRLFIFSDGAKSSTDQKSVDAVRTYLSKIHGFAEVNIIKRETNFGLANSIIDGVTQLCEQFGRVIVLEDDLLVTPAFLSYMNLALGIFENNKNIAAVSGYMFPIKHEYSHKVFLRNTPLSWGWATWDRAWSDFDTDGKELLRTLKKKRKLRKFNHTGPQPYCNMLKGQILGKNNSWFVRWAAYLFINDMQTIMPTQSLVKNIGIDGTGTHCAEWRFNPYHVDLDNTTYLDMDMLDVEKSAKIENKLKLYFIKIRILRYVNFVYRLIKG